MQAVSDSYKGFEAAFFMSKYVFKILLFIE